MEINPAFDVLFVEDVPADMELAIRVLRKEGLVFEYRRVETEKDFIDALDTRKPSIIISDYSMPEFDGMRALKISLERDPVLPFIIFTGSLNEETAVTCIKAGATDYVIKEKILRLPFAVIEALAHSKVIREKESAESALRASEFQYRLLAENMSDTVTLMDPNLRTLYISPSVVRARGYTLKEIATTSLEKHLSPESYQKAMEVLRFALSPENLDRPKPQTSFLIEMEMIRKDGTTFWSENNFTLILDKNNKPLNILGTGRDITKRKEALKALQESETRFSQAFHSNPSAVMISTFPEGLIIDVNGAFCKFSGYDKEDLIGTDMSAEKFWAIPKDREDAFEIFRKEGRIRDREIILKTKTGEVKVGIASIEPIEINNEQCVLSTMVDITQRKNALEALTKSESKFRSIAENLSDVIFMTDEKGIITYISPASLTVFGYESSEMIGHFFGEYLDDEERSRLFSIFRHTMETGHTSKNLQLRAVRRDGMNFNADLSSSILLEKNEIKGTLGLIRDITDRVNTENELKLHREHLEALVRIRTDELESANATKDLFFSIIAHDLKNPFAAMFMAAESLITYLEENNIERAIAKSKTMYNASMKSFALLQNLLEWSKSQLGRLKFEPTEFYLKNLVEENLPIVQNQADIKHIRFVDEIPADLKIVGDINLLQTILLNLITNGIKFTGNDGTVTIGARTGKDETEVSITDTGTGMTEEMKGQLFRIDVKVATKGTSGESGSGLGLILCKEFVEMHGGKIWVESEVGKGSTFIFTIPAGKEAPKSVKKKAMLD
jgi:PAS domain S-box-containing protein